jgi:hypothetical protein
MKLFTCQSCDQVVFFESVQCTRCGHILAYLPEKGIVSAVETEGTAKSGATAASADRWRALTEDAPEDRFRLCRNYTEHGVCNWVVRAEDGSEYCRACQLNHVIPNLADATAKESWRRIEIAKRRLLYSLFQLGLPVESKTENPKAGLAFDFLKAGAETPVFTGYSDGLITINIAEADDPFREKMREQLGETYRTVLGHLRHESGHYYWGRLVEEGPQAGAFRALFGDERASYEEARKRHYKEGPPDRWWDRFVSAYASMHPWEDWAETWAHYLHIVDGLETARAYGLSLEPEPIGAPREPKVSARRLDPHSFADLLKGWVPLTVALNSMNRSSGTSDCYPFVLAPTAIDKLRFVHEIVEQTAPES